MTLYRHRVNWTGLPGMPALSTFYTATAPTDADTVAIRDFFVAVGDRIASGVTIQVENSGATIDEATGALTGGWGPTTAVLPVTTTGGVNYAAPAGAVVQWVTAGVVHNRIVKGATFLVPLSSTVYDTAGTIGTGGLDDIRAAAAAFVVAMGTDLRVWSRPFTGSPTVPARSGSQHAVVSSLVPDKTVVLRSRRD